MVYSGLILERKQVVVTERGHLTRKEKERI